MTILVLCSLSALMAGCSKTDQTSTPAASSASETPNRAAEVQAAAERATAEAQKQAGDLKATADKAAGDAAKQAESLKANAPATAAAGAGIQAQNLIDQAKALINDKKYNEALTALQKLGQLKLTPEQQSMVDSLQALAQKSMAGQGAVGGTKSIGGALGGKN